jgi:hypothetical protein
VVVVEALLVVDTLEDVDDEETVPDDKDGAVELLELVEDEKLEIELDGEVETLDDDEAADELLVALEELDVPGLFQSQYYWLKNLNVIQLAKISAWGNSIKC